MHDFSYVQGLEHRHAMLAAACQELGLVVKELEGTRADDGAVVPDLVAKTEELRQLESELAAIWAMLQEAQGKSSKA
jgi:hypothetical protein